MSVLMVLTNTKKFADSKKDCGWYLPTVCFAYRAFIEAGFKVTICSPIGGVAPMDPESKELWDFTVCTEFTEDRPVMCLIEASKSARIINPDKYQIVYFAGGYGPIYDCYNIPHLKKIVTSVYEKGGIISGVGNGVVGLLNVKLSNGDYLIKGKNVTGFTNVELERSGNAPQMPFKLQDKINEQGGIFKEGPQQGLNVVQDDRIITGQNPTSTAELANCVIKAYQSLQPADRIQAPVNVLIMLTNTNEIQGQETGWYLPTVVYTYKACIEAGYNVTFGSPYGGYAPVDPESVSLWDHQECKDFLADKSIMDQIKRTVAARDIDGKKFNILHFAGGFGMMCDCRGNATLNKIVSDVFENSGVLSAVAQGTAGLLDVQLSFGDMLVETQHLATFTNEEVSRTPFANLVPYSLEDTLTEQEAMLVIGTPVKEHIVVAKSGRIVTSQNPNSSVNHGETLIRTYKDYEATNI